MSPIPHITFGHSGKLIHFAHANGFSPEIYEPFLSPFLKDHQIIASKFRPLWEGEHPNQLKGWNHFADDMIRFLDEQGLKNIIGFGHSLGGVTSMMVAIKRPDLFSKLVLLDPVVLSGAWMKMLTILPLFLKKKIIPVAQIANKRKDQWDSKNAVYESWRSKRVFTKLSDEQLRLLVDHSIIANKNGGVTLAYSKAWEAQVYASAPVFFNQLDKVKIPLVVVRGAESDVLSEKVWQNWQRLQPKNQFINFPETGHLLPFEAPQALAREIYPLL